MDSLHLSKRLATVAKYVTQDARMADIGSDHGYLPVNLALNNQIEFAIAGEVAPGPYNNAWREVNRQGVSEIVEPRFGNGLEVIHRSDNIDTLTIAGMGGNLISSILEQGSGRLSTVNNLILEPNVGAEIVREWISKNGFAIMAEEIISEDNHIYEIILARKVPYPFEYTEQELMFGPILLRERGAAFQAKWRGQIDHLQAAIEQMEHASTVPTAKIEEFRVTIQTIEDALK